MIDTQATMTPKTGAKKIGKQVQTNMQKSQEFDDLDRLYDILMQEKQMLQGYQIGSHEALEPSLLNLLADCRQRCQNQHTRILETLFNMGEYTADAASDAQIQDVVEVFSGYMNQLPYGTQNQ